MAYDYKTAQGQRGIAGIKTMLSTRRFYGLTPIDWGWAGHIAAGAFVAWQAWNGTNVFEGIGVDAPLYKVGVVAVAEVARAIMSIANVWEEEINWFASSLLVLVLVTSGGGDVTKLAGEIPVPRFDYSANVAQAPKVCVWKNTDSGKTLNEAEIKWCAETKSAKCACN